MVSPADFGGGHAWETNRRILADMLTVHYQRHPELFPGHWRNPEAVDKATEEIHKIHSEIYGGPLDEISARRLAKDALVECSDRASTMCRS